MFADALNPIVAKKKHEKKLEDKRKDYIKKKTISNYRSLQMKERLQKLKKSSKWNRTTKVIY